VAFHGKVDLRAAVRTRTRSSTYMPVTLALLVVPNFIIRRTSTTQAPLRRLHHRANVKAVAIIYCMNKKHSQPIICQSYPLPFNSLA